MDIVLENRISQLIDDMDSSFHWEVLTRNALSAFQRLVTAEQGKVARLRENLAHF